MKKSKKLLVILMGLGFFISFLPNCNIVMGKSEYKRIVAFGDSNTQGSNWNLYKYNEKTKWVNQIGQTVSVHNAGIAGETTEDAKRRFQKDVLDKKPEVVTIMFGTNDAVLTSKTQAKVSKTQFEKNLNYFVTTLKKQGTQVILMTTIPVVEQKFYQRHDKQLYSQHKGVRAFQNDYNDIVRKVAKEQNVPLVDIYRTIVEKAHGSSDKSLMSSGLIDQTGTHFTPNGANVIYQEVKEQLEVIDEMIRIHELSQKQ
ncbi:SGNH/GDSL hydrolase family protein [Lysinibacillus antri]|uniref:SGNH/GDSL hydrolase family protein n=1 Tax=Lysinibacillus antri TaxID=2498145 RepID=A0A3S0R5U2_9BACI|nr:GDSL-type esterase/lipase family protein [Lysinibacillus antri]RUL51762.1 SGNH/GDSL hydrolase family protein [Lysinibacillus antri]